MSKNIIGLLCAALFFTLVSCNSDDGGDDSPEQETKTATVNFMIETVFDGEDMRLNTEYITGGNDTVTFTDCRYFITGVSMVKDDGEEVALDDGYFLIDVTDDSNTQMWSTEVEEGSYASVKFYVGVDSLFNLVEASDAGDLDPTGSDGMLWVWGNGAPNNGYKFIKLEGTYKGDTTGTFTWHVGGNDYVKPYELTVNLDITKDNSYMIHVMGMMNKFFDNVHTLEMEEVNNVTAMPIDQATKIAENYGSSAFMVHHASAQ